MSSIPSRLRSLSFARRVATTAVVIGAMTLALPGIAIGDGATLASSTAGQLVTTSRPQLDLGATMDLDVPRSASPADRYAMADGCYAMRATDAASYIGRDGSGFAADQATLADATPFHFEPTELGVYLFFADAEDFVVASGSGVTSATTPSPEAEWIVDGTTIDGFTIVQFDTGEGLIAATDGTLSLGAEADASTFAFELTEDCATWPEVDINVSGPHPVGATTTEEARGFTDGHLHQMAFRFLSGGVHCGRPFHRYGATFALVDCPDHEPNGEGAALENFLNNGTPNGSHDTTGWPTFADWPASSSLTHEQTYYRWMERNWRGGLRLFTNLFVENAALCELYPIKAATSCNEMDSVRLQMQDMFEMQDFIDAQSGGPGKGWFRIVLDPFQAREVINDGKLAVVLGIETSLLFDCAIEAGQPTCTEDDIDAMFDEFHGAGIRQMELLNKFDSALSGVAGDGGTFGAIINAGNFYETGHWLDMRTCDHGLGEDVHDNEQDYGNPEVPEQDAIFGAINALYGPGAIAPSYPPAPHCNALGLSSLGSYLVQGMIDRGMVIDPDHMSVKGRVQLLDQVEAAGYEGIISSHGWGDPYAYENTLEMGGWISARSGSNTQSFINAWQDNVGWTDPRYYFGLGYGADANGLGAQPRAVAEFLDGAAVTYPFTGFGGVTINQNVSGERVYDVNVDGVAHYGLYPDWIEALRLIAGDAIVADMERAPEAYLQMWERAEGIAGDSCRPDVAPLTVAQIDALEVGTLWIDVLKQVGQARVREAEFYTYCVEGGQLARLTFDADDRLVGTSVAAGTVPALNGEAQTDGPDAAPVEPTNPLPTTGGGLAAVALLAMGGAALEITRSRRKRT